MRIVPSVLMLALMMAAALPGQETPPPNIPNTPIPEADLTEEARKLGMNSVVVLQLVVTPDGSARDIQVVRSAGFGLDQKAIDAVSKWRFQPGRKDGKPVAVYGRIEITFRLLDDDKTRPEDRRLPLGGIPTARIEFRPAGAAPPVVISGSFPSWSPPQPTHLILVFDVTAKGEVKDVRTNGRTPKFVLDAIRKLRFEPATRNSKPVRVEAELELWYR